MMLPATAFSSSSSSSANSAVVRVDKATSEFLNGPDWTINIDICDTINANHWLAKDVVKALKKRLQHKNPNVQLLSLTLLETMVKNCGENVHFQIAERNIFPEMIKIVKKKTDMRVREKILVLLDSWQEAFGGRGGKYPQYYFAYDELRQSGVQFPHRSPDAAPIFTPPVTHRSFGPPQANYGMPSNSSTRLDEAMASEIENLSLSMIESMRNVSDLLSDMLQAVDPNDRMAVKDEVIVDVVDRCRSNQKKLMQMLASTSDEELLGQGIELNDILQSVLAKHDAIASGSPIPAQITGSITPPTDTHKFPTDFSEEKEENPKSSPPPSIVVPKTEPEEEEDEDDFALLARRHSKAPTAVSPNGPVGNDSDPSSSMALVPIDPLPPVNTTRADEMIDFLSLTLSSPSTTTPPPPPPPSSHPISATSSQNVDQTPPFSAAPQSYVVPWAQSEPQPQPQQHQHLQVPVQPQPQPQLQPQYPQQNYSTGYIPPPWAATPGYYTNQYPSSSVPYQYSAPMPTSSYNNNNNYNHNNIQSQQVNSNAATAQRPFIPSYRLFEDLNVLGNPKTNGASSSNFSGSSGQSMMGGKK